MAKVHMLQKRAYVQEDSVNPKKAFLGMIPM